MGAKGVSSVTRFSKTECEWYEFFQDRRCLFDRRHRSREGRGRLPKWGKAYPVTNGLATSKMSGMATDLQVVVPRAYSAARMMPEATTAAVSMRITWGPNEAT